MEEQEGPTFNIGHSDCSTHLDTICFFSQLYIIPIILWINVKKKRTMLKYKIKIKLKNNWLRDIYADLMYGCLNVTNMTNMSSWAAVRGKYLPLKTLTLKWNRLSASSVLKLHFISSYSAWRKKTKTLSISLLFSSCYTTAIFNVTGKNGQITSHIRSQKFGLSWPTPCSCDIKTSQRFCCPGSV